MSGETPRNLRPPATLARIDASAGGSVTPGDKPWTRRPSGPPRSTAPPSERHPMIRLRFSQRQWNQLIALAEAAGVSPTVCAKRIVSDHLRRREQ